ncbi:MAG: phosphatidylglycerol---prolipoprotein diacylglyceryl transferase [Verrucomicrobiota bacterium]
MHKILLSAPEIGSYSAFLFLGLFGGYLIARWQAARAGIKGSHIDNLALLVSIFSLFGARFFSWLFFFPPGISLWKAFTNSGGGMVFYGGMIFGIFTAIIYARWARLPLGNLLDVFAPGLALGLALGRVGCFMAGCCWGDPCISPNDWSKASLPNLSWQMRTAPFMSGPRFPLAVRFPEGAGAYEQHLKLGLIDSRARLSQPVHPVQLYEAALAFGLCVWLLLTFAKRRWHGQVVCMFVLSYSVIRFGTEFLRADNAPQYLGMTLSQVISLVMGAVVAIVWLAQKSRSVPSEKRAEDREAEISKVETAVGC